MKKILIFTLLIQILVSLDCQANYRKKIITYPLKNISDWVGTYEPGTILAQLIEAELRNNYSFSFNLIQLDLSQERPDLNKIKTPAQFIITGKILKYQPAIPLRLENTPLGENLGQFAHAIIEIELLHGITRRVLWKNIFQDKTEAGNITIGSSKNTLLLEHPDFLKTGMGQLLTKLSKKIIPKLEEVIRNIPFQGQIVGVQKKNEEVVLNIGWINGVEIRDDFIVFGMEKKYKDSIYKSDLGDRFQQLGVVRVKTVHEGFSEAVILAGSDFSKGNLIQAKVFKPYIQPQDENKKPTQNDFIPRVKKPTKPFSKKTRGDKKQSFSKFNFFDLLGWDIQY